MSRETTRTLLAAVLFASFVAEILILFMVEDRATRMLLGVPALIAVMWTSSYVGLIERVTRSFNERTRLRRYHQLRRRVSLMMDDIKRMNWLAVDMDRGFRERQSGQAEMEAAQRRVAELASGLSEVAGVEGAAPPRSRAV